MDAALVDGFQERFGIRLEDRQFIGQSRVENRIGIFLIGIDVLFFAAADIGPDIHGRHGPAVAELLVPDHAADDARIRRGNAVVVVNAYLRQDAQGNLDLFIARQHVGQGIVQGVEAFDDDGLAFFQDCRLVVEMAVACDEIEAGQVDFLALVEVIDLLVEERYVDSPQGLEIVAAVGILRRIFAVIEVIVQGNADRPQAVDAELRRQALAERRLACR